MGGPVRWTPDRPGQQATFDIAGLVLVGVFESQNPGTGSELGPVVASIAQTQPCIT